MVRRKKCRFSQIRAALIPLLFGLYTPAALPAEDDSFVDVDNHELTTAYAHLVSFTAEPEIAAGSFTIDSDDPLSKDSTLKTMKFPLYKEFSSDEHAWSWYLQGAINYSSLEQKINFQLDPPLDGSSDIKWTGYSGLVEAGIIFPLPEGFSWAVGLGAGLSRLENKTRFSNPNLEAIFSGLLQDGSLFNWETNVSTVKGNFGLLYDRDHGRYGVRGSAHFTYNQIDSFDESRNFAGFSDHASTLTLKVDVRHPLNFEIREHPLYIIGHIGSTNFVGSGRDALGFNSFGEIGLSLGIQKVTLGVLGIVGDGVDGWNLILNYDY